MLKNIQANPRNLSIVSQVSKFSSSSLANDPKKKTTIKTRLFKGDELDNEQTYISSSQPKSMMRFHKIKKSENETRYEREYRIKYEQVQLWNHAYWAKNNEEFQEGKKQFKINLKQTDLVDDQHQQEQLLPYYKSFLNSNYHRNIAYNMEWYKKNFSLLIPALRANLSGLFRKFKT